MKLKKLNSDREVNISINAYRIDWDAPCRSKYQWAIKQWLKPYWSHHVCLEEFLIPGSRLRCDFVNLTRRVVIEMNGVQHDKFNKHFHRGNRVNFLNQVVRDQAKMNWSEQNGFTFVEIAPDDLPLTENFFKENYGVTIL